MPAKYTFTALDARRAEHDFAVFVAPGGHLFGFLQSTLHGLAFVPTTDALPTDLRDLADHYDGLSELHSVEAWLAAINAEPVAPAPADEAKAARRPRPWHDTSSAILRSAIGRAEARAAALRHGIGNAAQLLDEADQLDAEADDAGAGSPEAVDAGAEAVTYRAEARGVLARLLTPHPVEGNPLGARFETDARPGDVVVASLPPVGRRLAIRRAVALLREADRLDAQVVAGCTPPPSPRELRASATAHRAEALAVLTAAE